MAFTLINHLDNYARPLKCLNDQGGICGESSSKTTYWTYPIAFANKCFTMSATSLIEQYQTYAWAKSVNKTQFISGLNNDYNGYYASNAMTYVAIGY